MSESRQERLHAMREVLQMLAEIGWIQYSRLDPEDIAIEWTQEITDALKLLDRLFEDVLPRLTPLQFRCLAFLINVCVTLGENSD